MNTLISRSRTISQFLLSPSRTLYIHLFSTSPSSPPNFHHFRYLSTCSSDQKSRNERVSVWWDMENCGVPTGLNMYKIVHLIGAAVRANGIEGPVQITAFGDVSRDNQEALSSAGVNIVNTPNGLKNGADRSLLVDLMYWVSQNPPPAHIFLISGDRNFVSILQKLRKRNYNILLAAREGEQAPGDLYSAASIIWHWNEFVKCAGMHFDLLPDNPFSEDPFTMWERPKSQAIEDSSNVKQSFYYEHRPVPAAVLDQLWKILRSYPGGLTITKLCNELEKRNVSIDKSFYGYKNFLDLLLALPYIVNVQSCPDGQFFLRLASIAILQSVPRQVGLLKSTSDDGSRKVLDAPLRHDEQKSTEEENSKLQNVFGYNVDAEKRTEKNFGSQDTSFAGLKAKKKELAQHMEN